jgi:hypothetical protein
MRARSPLIESEVRDWIKWDVTIMRDEYEQKKTAFVFEELGGIYRIACVA